MSRSESIISKRRLELNLDSRVIILLVMCFFLGRVNILHKLYPFGIAFIGAHIILKNANKGLIIASILGTLSSMGIEGFSYYFAAIFIYGFFTIYKGNKDYSLITASTIVAVLFTIIRFLGIAITNNLVVYDMVMIAFEGLLVFTMTYVFSFSFPIEELGTKELSSEKMICSFITMALVLSGINNVGILGVSIKNIFSVLIVLLLSYNQGIFVGGLTGILLGMVAYISNVEMPFIIALLAVGGMLSGLFKELGKSGSIIGFILGNGIISFYVNGLGTSFLNYWEILFASLAFLGIYNKVDKILEGVFKPTSKIKKEYENKKFELASNRLANMSELLESMADTFNNTLEERDVFSSSEIYNIIDNIYTGKCKDCENCQSCWEKQYYTTYYSLFTTIGILESDDEDKEKLINDVLENCENLQTMKTSIEEAYKCYKEKERFKKRLKEQRMVLIEQLQGLSKVVNDLNLDVYKNATFNEELEELLEKEIKDKRFDIKEVLVAQLTGDDIEVYLEFGTNNTLDRIERVKRIVSDALGYPVTADYAFGSIESTNRFKLIRTNRYGALTKVSGIPKYDNEISGDNYTFGEIENTSYAIICDGMGTGDMASNESKAAIEILEKMLEVNIDRGMTVKTMNNILKTRSSEEIFTTLDLSFMDLYKGRLQFIKSGAPPTFIKRGDEVKVINSLSLPIGILNDVDFNIYEENIEDGDLVIMMSDGVLDCNKDTDSPEKWMKSLIAGLQSQSPQSIADEILKIAKLFSKDEIADDMTVMVTKVWRNSN